MTPQHLQQNTHYHERYTSLVSSLTHAHAWGVAEVHLDPAALQRGLVAVVRFSGILRNGRPLQAGNLGDAPIAPREPPRQRPDEDDTVLVYIGIAATGIAAPRDASELDQTADAPASPRRQAWHSETLRVADEARRDPSYVDVQFCSPQPQLLFGCECDAGYDSLPVACLRRSSEGCLQVVESFVPPLLRIGAAPQILARANALVASLRRRRKALKTANSRFHNSTHMTRVELQQRENEQAIATVLPLLAYSAQRPSDPPSHMVHALLLALGALARDSHHVHTNTVHGDAPAPAPMWRDDALEHYDHNTPGEFFAAAFDRLEAALAQCTTPKTIVVVMQRRCDTLFEVEIPAAALPATSVTLSINGEWEADSATLANAGSLLKLAPQSVLPGLLRSASPGLPVAVIEHEPDPPCNAVERSTLRFAVDISDPRWRAVRAERQIGLYVPTAAHPTTCKLEFSVDGEPSTARMPRFEASPNDDYDDYDDYANTAPAAGSSATRSPRPRAIQEMNP